MNVRDLTEMVPMAQVSASFERAAANYQTHAKVQMAMADWVAAWLPVVREGRALEIGAGPGIFTRRLLPWNGPLFATDISSAMCAAGQAAWPEANWLPMAADAPSDGPWAWIFSSSMLQWAADPEAIFAAWRDHLSRDGRILAGLFVAQTLPELRALIGPPDQLPWRTVEEWREYVGRSGLQIVRESIERRVFQHGSALALLQSLHGTGTAPQRHVTPGRLRRVLQEYDDRHGSAAGVSSTWTFYRFEARKAE